jgi:hypothetical protein
MTIRIIGVHPLEKDENGRLRTRTGTVFPRDRVVVTVPGISHMMQREAYLDALNEERKAVGQPELSPEQRTEKWFEGVDLIMEQEWSDEASDEPSESQGEAKVEDKVLIRPDPDQMPLTFAADELLRELDPPVCVQQVHFLAVRNAQVRTAVKLHGQTWRIAPLPQSPAQMKQMVNASKTNLGGRDIYYHNKTTGTRLLTCGELARLGDLGTEELRSQLLEIQHFCRRLNGLGNPEIGFFLADSGFSKLDFAQYDFPDLSPEALTAAHHKLAAKFSNAVPEDMRQDNAENEAWRCRMFAALIGERDEVVPEETMLGLSSEFFMQIQWLPGARFDKGELLLDPCFFEPETASAHARKGDDNPLGFIFNFVREFGSLEYVNIGRVIGSMSRSREPQGRRDVYIAVLKTPDAEREIVKIIRMQKWGVREHLDDGQDLLHALLKSDGYTEYVLDRRLACRQLGMNLTQRILARKVSETYHGKQKRYHGFEILSTYFERDYIPGVATDKIPPGRFRRPEYALAFARLLGRAAAPNLIVGRCGTGGRVVFDDGDEVVLETEEGLPREIVLADQMGTFNNHTTKLVDFAKDYAEPVNRRIEFLPQPAAFAAAYLDGFLEHFQQIQEQYRKGRNAFDALFRRRHRFTHGANIALRWAEVLRRLDKTKPQQVTAAIRDHLDAACEAKANGAA